MAVAKLSKQEWAPMRMAVPFAGIDSPGRAAKRNKWPITHVNVIEKKHWLMEYLSCVTGKHVQPRDIMDVDLAKLDSADILVASPPCQPHTKMGKQAGSADDRCEPFFQVVKVAAELSWRGDLKAVIFEQSPSIMDSKKGAPPCIDALDRCWKEHMPEWTQLVRWIEDGKMANVPTQRYRLFLSSVPICFVTAMGFPFKRPPAAPYTAKLVDFLETGNKDFSSRADLAIPTGMKPYYDDYKKHFQKEFEQHPDFSVGVCDLCRGMEKAFTALTKKDEIPSLTGGAWYLTIFGLSAEAQCKVGPKGRYLTMKERAAIYGHDGELLLQHMSPRQVNDALANTVIVPNMERVMGAVLDYVNAVKEKAQMVPPVPKRAFESKKDDKDNDDVDGQARQKRQRAFESIKNEEDSDDVD